MYIFFIIVLFLMIACYGRPRVAAFGLVRMIWFVQGYNVWLFFFLLACIAYPLGLVHRCRERESRIQLLVCVWLLSLLHAVLLLETPAEDRREGAEGQLREHGVTDGSSPGACG